MHRIVGSALASKLLLQRCRTDAQKTSLQRLGIKLGIPEWTEEFEIKATPKNVKEEEPVVEPITEDMPSFDLEEENQERPEVHLFLK